MTKVYDFPTFAIAKQLFYVPGAAISGGFTTGGAMITSPDPGGRGQLDIQPAMQNNEWAYPFSSWVMSKTNGQVLRIRLAPTPQIANGQLIRGVGSPWNSTTSPVVNPALPWDSNADWADDLTAFYTADALEGTLTVSINMGSISVGEILQPGHVIGHQNYCYMIDEIFYSANSDGTILSATINLVNPLRVDIGVNDKVLYRPYFMGCISNPDNVRTTYDATNNGLIQMGLITLTEAIVTPDD